MNGHQELVGFIWSIAELLRGDYKQSEYGRIVLPFTVLRRLDCVMEASREKVFAAEKKLPKGIDPVTRDMLTKDIEVVTTLFAVWNDMLIDKVLVTDDAIVNGVLEETTPRCW